MNDDWAQLAQRAGAGDRSAFRTLVERTQVVAYRVALRMLGSPAEAEDALQEAYLQIWNARTRLRDPDAVRGWMFAIVRNVASKRARARQRRRKREPQSVGATGDMDRLASYLAAESPGPEDVVAEAQLRATVMGLVDTLGEKHRVVLLLRVVDGMGYDEIAQSLGLPVGTVESRLHRARQLLGKKLERALGRRRGAA